jgi:prevent-host-death family protein
MYTLNMVTTMQSIPFTEARAHLAETLRSVENSDRPLLISRRNQNVGVLMSIKQYEQLNHSPASFSERLTQWRETHAQTEEVDPFTDVRESDQGRDFSW